MTNAFIIIVILVSVSIMLCIVHIVIIPIAIGTNFIIAHTVDGHLNDDIQLITVSFGHCATTPDARQLASTGPAGVRKVGGLLPARMCEKGWGVA
jgi:hypothetical protein